MGVAQRGSGIAGSWAGGVDGMEVTNALLGQVDVGNSLNRVTRRTCMTPVTF